MTNIEENDNAINEETNGNVISFPSQDPATDADGTIPIVGDAAPEAEHVQEFVDHLLAMGKEVAESEGTDYVMFSMSNDPEKASFRQWMMDNMPSTSHVSLPDLLDDDGDDSEDENAPRQTPPLTNQATSHPSNPFICEDSEPVT